jgi:hypothetical protein
MTDRTSTSAVDVLFTIELAEESGDEGQLLFIYGRYNKYVGTSPRRAGRAGSAEARGYERCNTGKMCQFAWKS